MSFEVFPTATPPRTTEEIGGSAVRAPPPNTRLLSTYTDELETEPSAGAGCLKVDFETPRHAAPTLQNSVLHNRDLKTVVAGAVGSSKGNKSIPPAHLMLKWS